MTVTTHTPLDQDTVNAAIDRMEEIRVLHESGEWRAAGQQIQELVYLLSASGLRSSHVCTMTLLGFAGKVSVGHYLTRPNEALSAHYAAVGTIALAGRRG